MRPACKIALHADGNWTMPAIGFSRSLRKPPEAIVFCTIMRVAYVYLHCAIMRCVPAEILPGMLAVIMRQPFPTRKQWGA